MAVTLKEAEDSTWLWRNDGPEQNREAEAGTVRTREQRQGSWDVTLTPLIMKSAATEQAGPSGHSAICSAFCLNHPCWCPLFTNSGQPVDGTVSLLSRKHVFHAGN